MTAWEAEESDSNEMASHNSGLVVNYGETERQFVLGCRRTWTNTRIEFRIFALGSTSKSLWQNGKDGYRGSSSSRASQSLEPARNTPIGNKNQDNSKQSKRDNKEDVIFFGGAATRPELGPVKLESLADHYIPLESMHTNERIQAFYFWLGKVYVNRTPPHEPNEGTRAEDDPFLVLQFTKDYEAGGWRKLGVGVTLEEMALMTELSSGHRFMTLMINSADPQQPGAASR